METTDAAMADAHERAATVGIRRAARPLRSALERDPKDVDLRAALVPLYRAGGALEQAGRYSVVAPDADPDEVSAYLRWAIAQGADEARVRHLSLLDDSQPLPEDFVADLAAGRVRRTPAEAWDELGGTAMFVFAALIVITLVATFAVVIFWAPAAPFIAHFGSRLFALAWAVAFACFAVADALRHRGKGAAWKGVVSVVLFVFGAAGLVSLFTGGF
ncbi:hypothetical protein E1I21_04610 [Microbacterium oleivorans]|uniref:DUF6584 family protein n=1 Tax=Microbacterium oleivorans TaxID=273677 RepID=UPI0010A36F21|nr:DUF6584 family protein [Microbacterium oleivorans]THE07996.1 hypothetical protein E1I21_04610 [Microbacterium oleivorans]